MVPMCQATPNAEDDTKTDISVTLSISKDLMCVVGYHIQFHGESRNVSLDSPPETFTISVEKGQPFPNEIVVVRTLDYENRTGKVPCTFKVAGKFGKVLHYYQCNTKHLL